VPLTFSLTLTVDNKAEFTSGIMEQWNIGRMGKTEVQRISNNLKNWIPAFAGMTKQDASNLL
jgi:hypothetical protein